MLIIIKDLFKQLWNGKNTDFNRKWMQLFLTAAKLDKIIKRKSIFDKKSIARLSKFNLCRQFDYISFWLTFCKFSRMRFFGE